MKNLVGGWEISGNYYYMPVVRRCKYIGGHPSGFHDL